MKCKLGDIININQYTYTPYDQWKYVNYLDTGNITKNVIDTVQYIDLSKETLPSRARRKVKNGSILYSMVRPNQSHYGIINNPDASVGAQCSTFRTVCSIRWLQSALIPFVTTQASGY